MGSRHPVEPHGFALPAEGGAACQGRVADQRTVSRGRTGDACGARADLPLQCHEPSRIRWISGRDRQEQRRIVDSDSNTRVQK
jgi:hypothetical protein